MIRKLRKKVRKTAKKKTFTVLKQWAFDYDGAAIYCLKDQFGMVYVGQAKNLQNRLKQHRYALQRVLEGGKGDGEGAKIRKAVQGGSVFEASILELISADDSTVNNLREKEAYWVDKFGGLSGTYNTGVMHAPNWRVNDFNEPMNK